jgi:AcrR family transcriptional regulator
MVPMSNLRAAQRAMTRRLLMTAALELFENKGYAPTTVDDIATAAGTTRATFYAYFPSRSELMKALIDERLNEELQRSRSPERGSTAQGLITAVKEGTPEAIGAWMRQTAGHWQAIRPILRIGRDAAVVDPELGQLVERWMEEAINDIQDALDQAGRFQPHQRHFRGVLAMAELDFVAQHWEDADWHLTRDQMLDELTDSWVRLLGR